jgi:hypothetical protein
MKSLSLNAVNVECFEQHKSMNESREEARLCYLLFFFASVIVIPPEDDDRRLLVLMQLGYSPALLLYFSRVDLCKIFYS